MDEEIVTQVPELFSITEKGDGAVDWKYGEEIKAAGSLMDIQWGYLDGQLHVCRTTFGVRGTGSVQHEVKSCRVVGTYKLGSFHCTFVIVKFCLSVKELAGVK